MINIGSAQGMDVVVPHSRVEAHHASIFFNHEKNRWFVMDVGGGTYIRLKTKA